jgi:hypothetical protein
MKKEQTKPSIEDSKSLLKDKDQPIIPLNQVIKNAPPTDLGQNNETDEKKKEPDKTGNR